MKIFSRILFCLVISVPFALQSQSEYYGPPKPPLGKRWVLNHNLSDEFNGTSLDTTKWYDYHPTWKGREPGIFLPSQVSVSDGYLKIQGKKLEKDTILYSRDGSKSVFNIAGGAVVSRNTGHFGYYECKMKASKTTLSATFWFSGGGGTGPKGCDSYHQEWDIQECIGRIGDFQGVYFAKGMHSNAHYWYTECEGKRHDYRAPQVLYNEDELASESFHVYGGWWRDETSASYYYDHNLPKHQKFFDSISKNSMDKPMYLRLVCETYPFPWIELPTDEELNNPLKNTVCYDWVRGYNLIDANESVPDNSEVKPLIYSEMVLFDNEQIDFNSSSTLSIPLSYKLNTDRSILLELSDSKKNVVHKEEVEAYAGYSYISHEFKMDRGQLESGTYLLKATISYDNQPIKQRMGSSYIYINIE